MLLLVTCILIGPYKVAKNLAREVSGERSDLQSESIPSLTLVGQVVDQREVGNAANQRIASVVVDAVQLPLLVGSDFNPMLRIRVEVEGDRQPLSIVSISASIAGTVNNEDGGWIEIVPAFDLENAKDGPKRFGKSVKGMGQHRFRGNYPLQQGLNELWLCCSLSGDAIVDRKISPAVRWISFSDGSRKDLPSSNSNHRLGLALREHLQDGVHTHRIPGLATTNAGTLIAVYDRRMDGSTDLPGDIDVGMSRSTDGGRTWEPSRVIMDMGNDPDWRNDGIGDPAVLVDRETGTIWVAATWSHGNRSWHGSGPGLTPEETGQFMLVRSDDDGASWSAPINITKQIKRPEWCFLLAGPGKGITMRDGTLVFAAQYQLPEDQNRRPHSTIVYSTDYGQTWNIGTGAHADTTEAQVVETEPGTLMLNCRYNKGNVRVVMTTNDLGLTWREHPTSKRSLIEPRSCMASLINTGDLLLFANPDSAKKRERITIKVSTDRGITWPKANQLLLDQDEGRGYSCLSMIDERTVGILYESSRADLVFQRIPLSDLIQ